MKREVCIVALFFAIFTCLSALPVHAQSASTGAISGLITDSTGAVVPSARIRATNQATGASRTVYSRSAGNYLVPLLPPRHVPSRSLERGFQAFRLPRGGGERDGD